MPRLLSGFIEAIDVQDATSGGVKNDQVDPSGDTARGFRKCSISPNRVQAAFKQIVAYFNFDLAQLRGYGLGAPAENFLIALALFKICRFLRVGLRLRTACDLEAHDGLKVTRPETFKMPDERILGDTLKSTVRSMHQRRTVRKCD